MAKRRVWANTTVLPNGEVLVTGGSAFENRDVDSALVSEMWNPETRQFRQVASASTFRLYHSISLLLPDASVLVAGGGAPGPRNQLNGEIYYPPYLYDGNGNLAPRLTIGAMGDRFPYNANVNVPYYGVGKVRRVTLIRTGAVTHSFDMGQRFLELPFTQRNGAVEVIMPDSPNIAPPGYYMLFLINEAGVPSVAKILNLNTKNTAPADPEPAAGLKVGDIYSLVASFSNKCVDVAGQSPDDGAALQQYECNGTAAQKFRLIQNPSGALSLQNINSGKCLDIENMSQQNGAVLQQWGCGGTGNQSLNLNAQGDGSYQISFAHSNKCLDVPAANPASGVHLHQWDCTGSPQQKWLLLK